MDDYVIDGDLVFSNQSSALKFYREQYHKKKEWVGLTEDDALQLLPVMPYEYDVDVEMILKFAEAIEAKLKEKNNA